jgi:hypothetical protein
MKEAIVMLNRGSGVVDAAGGSGHVSMALSMAGIQSTVVDPRPAVGKLPGRDRKYYQRQIRRQWNIMDDASAVTTIMSDNECGNSTNLYCLPVVPFKSIRAWIGVPPIDIDHNRRQPDNHNGPLPVVACNDRNEFDDNDDDSGNINNIIHEDQSTACLLATCSAIVALHPDEATDAVVDSAILNQIPFAIVPCCVYSRLFPHRRIKRWKPLLKSSTDDDDAAAVAAAHSTPTTIAAARETYEPVVTYHDLLDYLQAKHPSIQRTTLPFLGANVVLWSVFL